MVTYLDNVVLPKLGNEGKLVIGNRGCVFPEGIRLNMLTENIEGETKPVITGTDLESFLRIVPKGYCVPESQLVFRAAMRAQAGAALRQSDREQAGASPETWYIIANNFLITQLDGKGYDILDNHLREVIDETKIFQGHDIRDNLSRVALYLTRPKPITRGINTGKIAARRKWNYTFCLMPILPNPSSIRNMIGYLVGLGDTTATMGEVEGNGERFLNLVSTITGIEKGKIQDERFPFKTTQIVMEGSGPVYQVVMQHSIPGVNPVEPLIHSLHLDSERNYTAMALVMKTPKYTRKLRKL